MSYFKASVIVLLITSSFFSGAVVASLLETTTTNWLFMGLPIFALTFAFIIVIPSPLNPDNQERKH